MNGSALESYYPEEHDQKRKPWLLILLPLVFVAVIGWPLWQVNRPPFRLSLLESLTPGMTKEQVLEILPKPKYDEGSTWTYTRKGAWPILYVNFDGSGRFLDTEYDY